MLLSYVVIECDPPYDERHVATHGASFKPWTQDLYDAVIDSVTRGFKQFSPTLLVHLSISYCL